MGVLLRASAAGALALLLAAAVAGQAFAFAGGPFVVRPDGEPAMQGWKLAALQGSGSYTPCAQFEDLTGYEFGVLDPAPAGTGAVHLQPWEGYTNPAPHSCLGTNNFAGIKIKDVLAIRYAACVTFASYAGNDAIPPVIEFYLTDGTELHMFEWQAPIPASTYMWNTWDISLQGTFKEWDPPEGAQWSGDWTWFKQRAGEMWFAGGDDYPIPVGSTVGASNITGTSCNIRNGSPRVAATGWQSNGQSAWWRNNATSEAWVDNFELVLGDATYTYDFEAGRNLALTPKAAAQPIMAESCLRYAYRAVGRVVNVNTNYFKLDDGSGKMIEVRCQKWQNTLGVPSDTNIIFAEVLGSIVNPDPDMPQMSTRRQLIRKL